MAGLVLAGVLLLDEAIRLVLLLADLPPQGDGRASAVLGTLLAHVAVALPLPLGALGALLLGTDARRARTGGVIALIAMVASWLLAPAAATVAAIVGSGDPAASSRIPVIVASVIGALCALAAATGFGLALRAPSSTAGTEAAAEPRRAASSRPWAIAAIVLAALWVLGPLGSAIGRFVVQQAVISSPSFDPGLYQAASYAVSLPAGFVIVALLLVLARMIRISPPASRARRGAVLALGGLVLGEVLASLLQFGLSFLLALGASPGAGGSAMPLSILSFLGVVLATGAVLIGAILVIVGAVRALRRD